jgi:hypothetical protein
MTIITVVINLKCDKCPMWQAVCADSVVHAEVNARRMGWSLQPKQDLCPTCHDETGKK